ncbi:hypothetical protein IMCC9480_1035 [Oxalobacteraceae bacterium IMCC9480]|nr:hypothetical protein IMCC9480_1035 [Oxalobacteraceae bacterium IMCC9480]NDP60296.1 DUF2442 domain-containing protein [Oxalobacteraceae bacterium]
MKTLKASGDFNKPVTEEALAQAMTQGRARVDAGLHATTVQYLPAYASVLVGFSDRSAVLLPIQNYPELAELTVTELDQLTLGFGGSALCLPTRDLHVAIAGLVSASPPLMAMASSVIAARNGSRSSAAKVRASRENGQKGGRPRKLATG